MRPIDSIILHHVAALSGNLDIEDLRRIHKDRGWKTVGYHYYVRRKGAFYAVEQGRPVADIGAHAKGNNETSIGIAFDGHFEEELMPEAQLQIGLELVERLCIRFNVDSLGILAHNEVRETLCPGRYFPLDRIRGEIADRLRWRQT